MNTARWIVAAASLALSACGAGVAAVVAGTSGGSASSNTPPFVSGSIDVTDGDPAAPTAPDFLARISFLLFDPDPNPQPVDLAIEFRLPGSQDFVPAALVLDARDPSVSTSLDDLATDGAGIEHRKAWDYGAQLGSTALRRDTLLRIRVRNSASGPSIVIPFLGNEAPEVRNPAVPEGESSGLVIVPFGLRDSSADRVSVRVEFEDPDAPGTWRLARPFGLVPSAATPEFAFRDLPTAPDVVLPLQFLWDSTFDLAGREAAERLRFTPVDRAQGTPLASAPFFVDNNALPVAQLDDAALITNDDQGRGIPIPFKLTDAESDPIDVVLQWRLEDGTFPPLPSDAAELRALLEDPERRRELQICTELPITGNGRVAMRESFDPRFFVGTPEIGLEMGYLFGRGLDGQWIDIMRPHADPRPVAASWPANPLEGPIAVVPRDEGRSALVLDGAGTGRWRLREIELATGRVLREHGEDTGEPTALAFEPGERAAVVATHFGDSWQLQRVGLDQPGVTVLAVAPEDDPSVRGELRGLVSLGTAVALATVQDALIRINYPEVDIPDADPPVARLVPNLKTPWGLLRDPFVPNKVYLAERDFDNGNGRPPGRILHVNLDTHEKTAVVVPDPALSQLADAVDIPHPQSLTYQHEGARLIVVTDANPTDGTLELRGIRLGAGEEAYELARGMRVGPGEVHASRDGIVALALPTDDDLATGEGVLQSRRIARYHPENLSIEVAEPFEPPPTSGVAWRIRTFIQPGRSSPGGRNNVFLWNSSDAPFQVPVQLRVIPLDADAGVGSQQLLSIAARGSFDQSASLTLSTRGRLQTADLDSDGRLDIIVWDDRRANVHYQRGRRGFSALPDFQLPLNDGFVLAADLNGDAKTDLGVVTRSPPSLKILIYLQDTLGGPDALQDLEILFPHPGGARIWAADMDADGLVDLVGQRGTSVSILFGTRNGLFPLQESLLIPLGGYQVPGLQPINLDGDARIDLVGIRDTECGDNDVLELRGRGRESPVLETTSLDQTPFIICDWETVLGFDLTGDGRQENVVAGDDRFGSRFVGLEPHYRESSGVPVIEREGRVRGLASADMNADGLYDLVTSNGIYYQGEVANFPAIPGMLEPFGSPDFNLDVNTDVDGDGYLDTVSGGLGAGARVSFHHSPEVPLPALPNFQLPAFTSPFADLNSDGQLDLVSSTSKIFFQRNPGLFPSIADLELPVAIHKIAEMSGDGGPDLIGSDFGSPALSVFVQENGAFSSAPSMSLPVPIIYALVDLDSDGMLDIVGNDFEDLVSVDVFFQREDRTFGSEPDVAFDALSVRAVDLDGDGTLDLLRSTWTCCAPPTVLDAFYQVSPRQFVGPEFVATLDSFPGAIHFLFADLDIDGRIDMLASDQDSEVFFHRGDPRSPFGSEPDLVWGSTISSEARDWTGDGRPDVLLSGGVLQVQTAPRRFHAVSIPIPYGWVTDLDLDGDPDLIADQVYSGRH